MPNYTTNDLKYWVAYINSEKCPDFPLRSVKLLLEDLLELRVGCKAGLQAVVGSMEAAAEYACNEAKELKAMYKL